MFKTQNYVKIVIGKITIKLLTDAEAISARTGCQSRSRIRLR